MRIVSANVDSIKNAPRLFALPHVAEADVVCMQETNGEGVSQMAERLGYHFVEARVREKKGGVAIFSRFPIQPLPLSADVESLLPQGQIVSGKINDLSFLSVYVTHDSSTRKLSALGSAFAELLDRRAIIAGDMNIFRDGRDSWRYSAAIDRRNRGTYEYGCDAIAMDWFSSIFKAGWVDLIGRHSRVRPVYTYWNTLGHYARKQGTRLDYILGSPPIQSDVDPTSVLVADAVRFGRHAQIACTIR